MAKTFRIGNAVLAEYISLGNRNKHVLVNVYSGDVLVPSFPTELQFGVYVELIRGRTGSIPDEFSLQLLYAGAEIMKGKGSGHAGDNRSITFVIPQVTFQVQEEGVLEFKIAAPGFQVATAITKRIYQGDIPAF